MDFPLNTSLWNNVSVWCGVSAWLLAQFIKLFTFMVREKRFDFAFLFRFGGMPSSHTAACAAAAVSVGIRAGFGSTAFCAMFGLLMTIMIDAQGVRHEAGEQAKLLNRIADEFYASRKLPRERLVEFLGHTRWEVFWGLILGVVLACAVHAALPGAAAP